MATFLTFPPELRIQIYRYLIPSEIEVEVIRGDDWHYHVQSTYDQRLNLQLTNRQIKEELEEIPKPVHFVRLYAGPLAFSGLGDSFVKCVRQIRVENQLVRDANENWLPLDNHRKWDENLLVKIRFYYESCEYSMAKVITRRRYEGLGGRTGRNHIEAYSDVAGPRLTW
jgi:hypothetical protein